MIFCKCLIHAYTGGWTKVSVCQANKYEAVLRIEWQNNAKLKAVFITYSKLEIKILRKGLERIIRLKEDG